MNVSKNQSGITVILGIILVLSLLVASGIGYRVYRARYKQAGTLVSNLQQNVVTPQSAPNPQPPPMGIDYPVDQGIKGKVFCNDKVDPVPCPTKIEIQIQRTDPSMTEGPVKTIETDAEGNFEYDTVPGTYIITPAPKTGYPMFVPPLPNPVIVKDRQMTEITITYHSGLR